MAVKGQLLSKAELDSVERLSSIRKAVYLMESLTTKGSYRFGGIGIKAGHGNTPIRRLGQCTDVKNGKVTSVWKFVAMVEFPSRTSPRSIREMEKVVRDYFFESPGDYASKQIDKKDAVKRASPDIEKIFKWSLRYRIKK